MRFRVERLAKQDRSSFDCGNDELNRYLKHAAGQDQRRRYAVCFLAIENETEAIAGYYSLSSGSVDLDRMPEESRRCFLDRDAIRFRTDPVDLLSMRANRNPQLGPTRLLRFLAWLMFQWCASSSAAIHRRNQPLR